MTDYEKPTPEEKCSHEWIQKTGLGYHCRKCRTAKIRPSPSPEARVDWEKESERIAYDLRDEWTYESKFGGERYTEIDGKKLKELIKALASAAFEKGREAR